MPLSLTLENLTLPKEKTYFGVAAAFASLFWLGLLAALIFCPWSVRFVLLAYSLGAFLFLWCVNGLLIAKLRAESVEVTEAQLPRLHAVHAEVCRALGETPVPPLYILQSGGLLNGFATRHGGRNFVVITSSLLEALGEASAEVRFLIGHEIGHLRRKHLTKRVFLWPGYVVPLLAHAYSRACEATCDRHGAFAAGESAGAARALLALAAGRETAQKAVPQAFAEQHRRHRGFFVSWHELKIGYPTLSQRVANVLALESPAPAPVRAAARNPLAYPAAFVFSIQMVVFLYFALIGA
ncbi:MAG TPA: M48 family metallopeptidase, partial [Candidatus Methylacidiphilales bacterium]